MKTAVAAGIDIGGTNTVFGLVNREGKILANGHLPTALYPSPETLAQKVSEAITQLAGNQYEIMGAGIGAPNGNYYTGEVVFAPNLHWKGIVPLAEYFKRFLRVPALLTNDANAAAYGEWLFGGAKNMKDFLFITLGTGLGSALVVNGKMVYGHDGFAGEVGHVIIKNEGRLCGCGRKGCLETYASATGIKRTYKELKPNTDDQQLSARYIFEKAKQGEKEALDSFELTGKMLGQELANSILYTSPEAIFLFGGLTRSGKYLLEPTLRHFEENVLNIYKGKIKILFSSLPENDAAILGSASLILKDLNAL